MAGTRDRYSVTPRRWAKSFLAAAINAVRGEHSERAITGKQATSFDVLEQRPIEVAAGDRLLLTANRRDAGFRATNREIVTVSKIESSRIRLEDGRTLPSNFSAAEIAVSFWSRRSTSSGPAMPIFAASGVKRRSALSWRSSNRNSAREVNMRYGSSTPLVTRSSIRTPIYAWRRSRNSELPSRI